METVFTVHESFRACGGMNSERPESREISSLTALRGTSACFQIVLETGVRCILNPGLSPALTEEISLPRYRAQVNSDFETKLSAVGYLADNEDVLRADLLKREPECIPGGLYGSFFCELSVPADAEPGEYEMTAAVYCTVGAFGERTVEVKSLSLTVLDFVLPPPSEFRLYLDLWQQSSNVARTFGTELWSDAHFQKLEAVLRSLAALGQKSVTVLAGDCPWRGWGCYLLKSTPAVLYEYSMARIFRKKDGSLRYDFSAIERYIELCFSCGISGDITVYGIMGIWTNMPLFPAAVADYPEKVLLRCYDENSGAFGYLTKREEIEGYLRALFAFFREKGWFGRVRIGADEPRDHGAYTENAALLRSIDPEIRFKMALDQESAIEAFGETTADVAASFPCSCKLGDRLRDWRKGADRRLLWYVCNIPDRPNTVLTSGLLESRAIGAIAYLLDFDGFLRWAYTCWTKDPCSEVRYNRASLPAGDVNLVYPSKDGGLLYSLRYFALKRGIEDYELMRRAEDVCGRERVLEALRRILFRTDTQQFMADERRTVPGIYSENASDYDAVRSELAGLLTDR